MKRIEITAKSGITGWRCSLQENYLSSEEFEGYCETHGIHKRLGYKNPKTAWKKNPIIEGSTNPSDFRKTPVIELLVPEVDSKYGAPMGRFSNTIDERPKDQKVYDRALPITSDGAYDKGGAYWGIGKQLRVEYTKDLSYIRFYRKGEN